MRGFLRIMAGVALVAALSGCDYVFPGGAPGSAGRDTPGDKSVSDQATGNTDHEGGAVRTPPYGESADSSQLGVEGGASTAAEPTITPANPDVWGKAPFVDGTGGDSNSGRLAGDTTNSGVNASGPSGTTPGETPELERAGTDDASGSAAGGAVSSTVDEQRTVPSPTDTVEVAINAAGVEPQQIGMQVGDLLQLNFTNNSPENVLALVEYDENIESVPIVTLPTSATAARPDDGEGNPGTDEVGAGTSQNLIDTYRVEVDRGGLRTIFVQQAAPTTLRVRFVNQASGEELGEGLTIVVEEGQ